MFMKKISIISLIVLCTISYAAKESLYEINGAGFDSLKKTKGPKALVKVNNYVDKKNQMLKSVYVDQDSFRVSLRDSVHWLEMEKNTDYTICTDDASDGMWKGMDFPFKRENNCIQLNSGNYVKSGKLWYVTNMGNVHTFNLLVGMKYIDLSKQEHMLGYSMVNLSSDRYGQIHDRDPVRYKKINEILAVDLYKVTECELIQTLWDSIPAQSDDKYPENYNFWIEKKKMMKKNGFCDIHDSAAVRIFLYNALVYANNRSIRDGLNPVYSLNIDNNPRNFSFNKKNSDFYIKGYSFFKPDSDWNMIFVTINKNADGYRLPYYEEWIALARGGNRANYENIWGGVKDSIEATRFAWFGKRESDDPMFAKSDEWKKDACGEWLQKSRPVGLLKPNAFGLYDMMGLVCENVVLENKNLYNFERFTTCKGGFLSDPLDSLNLGAHCDARNGALKSFQGLRLVRQIR